MNVKQTVQVSQYTMKRNSNFEFLRIVCMLMIIGGHIILAHDTMYSLSNPDEIINLLLMPFFYVHVNCFILISGYFGIRFKPERLFSMASQTVFYSVGLTLFAIILGWHVIVPKTDILRLFPILFKQYWFITCYVVLYIISPLLNKWVDSMEKSEYCRILIVGFVIIYVWPTLSFLVNAPQFINDSGYGIINFAYLYLLGRYLRVHFVDNRPSVTYWGGYFFSAMGLFLCQYALSWLLGFEFTSWQSYNTVFIFIGSVCFFMAFKSINIHSQVINYCAKPCLAVYIIHLHPDVWDVVTYKIGLSTFHGVSYLIIVIMLPFAIYLACAVIEIGRSELIGPAESRLCRYLIKVANNEFAK